MKYLICYDIRNIQGYIFATARLREISGASNIIKDNLEKYLKETCNKLELTVETDWENKDIQGFTSNVDIEIAYVGGGNVVLMAKDEQVAKEVSKQISLRFIKETGSLNLAYAIHKIDFSKSLGDNIVELNNKLREVKQTMPISASSASLPFTAFDQETNLPLSKWSHEFSKHVSNESSFKLKNYKKSTFENLDLMREKHDNSYLAVVHIDGNDMGKMISIYRKANCATKSNYDEKTFIEELESSRDISKSIKKYFNDLIVKVLKASKKEYRMVLNSGDDITFITKGINAISLVITYLEELNTKYLCDVDKKDNNSESDKELMRFSACAGIAFIKAHFPFNVGYEIAEECCNIAKQKVKSDKFNGQTKAGSSFDYHICQAGINRSVERIREGNENLYIRPIVINYKTDSIHSLENFEERINRIKELPRNVVKRIRNIYEVGKEQAEIEFELINSRQKIGEDLNPFEDGKALFYDVTEVLDLYEKVEVTFENEENQVKN